MALQVLAQGAVKVGQGAAKIGGQAIGAAGRSASKGIQTTGRASNASRVSQFRQSTNQARQQGPSSPLRELPSSQPLQSEAARRTSLQSAMRQAQNPLRQPAQAARAQKNDDADQEEEEQEEQRQVSFQSFMQLIRIKGAITDAADLSGQDDGSAGRAAANASQEAAKQAAKKMVPKAANAGANFLSTALDLGTGGAALLVTIFIHLLSLGWLNVEMVYGTWIKKGKDPVVGKLSWDPIPMPIDKNGLMLQGMVIMADLIVLTAVVIMFAVQIMMLLLLISPQLLIGYGISKLF